MKASTQTTCHLSRIDPSPWGDLGPLTTVLLDTRQSGFFIKKSLTKGCGVIPTVQLDYVSNIFRIINLNTIFFSMLFLSPKNYLIFTHFIYWIKNIIGIKTNRIDLINIKTIGFMIIWYIFLSFGRPNWRNQIYVDYVEGSIFYSMRSILVDAWPLTGSRTTDRLMFGLG